MGRIAKRVPLDFDWPLKETWDGYLMPKRLHEKECDACDGGGYAPESKALHDRWYGYAPFQPSETGSTPFTPETPQVRALAERNINHSPDYYGWGEPSIRHEAQRLAELFNGSWSHHLAQEDVDALIAEDRLRDFTHERTPDRGWVKRDPMPTITAAEVNLWSLAGFGHDSSNCFIVIEAKANRDGLPHLCPKCDGHGSIERWAGQRAEAEAWEPTEPPTGDGWQLWETTSEGSPMSPVFETPEALADWLAVNDASVFGNHTADAARWLKIITGEDFAHVQISPGVVVM